MWIGLTIGVIGAIVRGGYNFRFRGDPEPANSRIKLPFMLLLVAACIALAASGTEAIVFSILAAILVVQCGFVLAGRNPWWMQGALDRRAVRYQSAPPHDLDPSA
jgi:hypothetical protein